MVLQLPPLKNFAVVFIYRKGRKQEGAPPALAMDFFGGDPARTVKYIGFATPLKNFTVAFFCKYVCANIIYIYIYICVFKYMYVYIYIYECMKV